MDSKDRFDQKYKATPSAFGDSPMPAVQQAINFVPAGKALDLGVGNGRNALHLLDNSFAVTGVDVSEEGLSILKERSGNNKNLNLVLSNVLKFSTTDTFDLVLAVGLLHFLEIEDIHQLINNMSGWLNKDGVVVVVTRMTQNSRGDLPHVFSSGELQSLFQNETWEIIGYYEKAKEDRKVASLIARKI